jgi:hypothetical protein
VEKISEKNDDALWPFGKLNMMEKGEKREKNQTCENLIKHHFGFFQHNATLNFLHVYPALSFE